MKWICLIFISLVFSLGLVSALGVTPAMRTLEFKAGETVSGSFTIVNSGHENMDLSVSVGGDLNASVSVKDKVFTISSSEDSKIVEYDMTMPAELGPGPHTADIIVMQNLGQQQKGGTTIGSALAVKTQLSVFQPYPGKYLEAALNIDGSSKGGQVTFTIPMVNKGQWDIESVKANIDIYDGHDNKVESFNTDEISILSGERKELVANWAAEIPAGIYKAIVTLIFDENTVKLEGVFNVGEVDVELQEVNVKQFSLGSIAKFEMLVENKWSEPVRQIYSQTQVFSSKGDVLAEFKSPTYDIDPLTKRIFVSYWDTGGVKVGTYDASVLLKYGDKSSKKDLKFNVMDDRIEVSGLGYVISSAGSSGSTSERLLMILLVVVVILVVVNLGWFLMLRKRMASESIEKKK